MCYSKVADFSCPALMGLVFGQGDSGREGEMGQVELYWVVSCLGYLSVVGRHHFCVHV